MSISMSGTDLRPAAPRREAWDGHTWSWQLPVPPYARAMRSAVLTARMVLRARYVMSGTDRAYGANRRESGGSTTLQYQYPTPCPVPLASAVPRVTGHPAVLKCGCYGVCGTEFRYWDATGCAVLRFGRVCGTEFGYGGTGCVVLSLGMVCSTEFGYGGPGCAAFHMKQNTVCASEDHVIYFHVRSLSLLPLSFLLS
eukprot:1213386-Rhodomonas_salina.1